MAETVHNAMRKLSKNARPTFLISAITFASLVNTALAQQAATPPQNLVAGVSGSLGPDPIEKDWAGRSAINVIPGAALFPVSSPTTVLYIGFTQGMVADISNMVLYTTNRQSRTITAVTPVTLNGVSNPSIQLEDTGVCPIEPSQATPCIVRLDPMALTLSALNDYYFVVYFTNNSLNLRIQPTFPSIESTDAGSGSLYGSRTIYDGTRRKVGEYLPSYHSIIGHRPPSFLMYVMSN